MAIPVRTGASALGGALAGKVVFVTGAARGIGRAVCDQLLGAGAHVVAGVRNPDDVGAVGDALRRQAAASPAPEGAPRTLTLACDVSDEASVTAAFAAVDAQFGRLDALVNNAGVVDPIGYLLDTDPQQWMRALQVNVGGVYLCARAALPRLIAGGGGAIVNVSSGAALRARVGWSAYGASKAALNLLSSSLNEEYAAQGIQSFSFAPGMVDTSMQTRIRESGVNEVSRTPRDRLLDPAWPAAIIAWLASGRAQRFVGTYLHIDHVDLQAALAEAGVIRPPSR